MKKHFYLLVVPILLAIVMGSCTRTDCSHEPYYFTIVVKKGSPEYSLFLKDSLIDEKAIDLFKSGNTDRSYPISVKFGDMWGNSSRTHKDLFITTDFEGDFFTGRKEVLYLKNRSKTYTLEILGTVEATKHCGAYSELKEASVNGVRQADSITGRQIIKL